MEDSNYKIEKIVREAKDLLAIFEEVKKKTEINSSSSILRNLDRVSIAKYIVPYLDLKDLISFRSTCKDINGAVSSTVAIVSYYKSINSKKANSNNLNVMLKPFNELNDPDDIEVELESLKNIRDFLTQKLFQSESIIKLYKNDLEYLKSELISQNEITDRLSETLNQTRDELEESKKQNLNIKQKLEDTIKRFDENNSQFQKKQDDLVKSLEELRNEKNTLATGIFKLKKISDDLKKKNIEKSEALKSIRNFFLTSTVFKIKNIAEYEENYKKEKNTDLDNKTTIK